jgi:phosphoglycerate-specific signal transduction histidine kinase
MNILYTINQSDPVVGVWDKSILLHLDDNLIIRLRNFDELAEVIDQLNWIKNDVFTNYPEISH